MVKMHCTGRMSNISFGRYPPFPHVSKYSGKKRKRCSFAGGTKFSPFIARREPRKLFNLGLGGGLILWDASVTRVNGRFASNQPSYSSIYIKYSCEIQKKLINKQTKNSLVPQTPRPGDGTFRTTLLCAFFTQPVRQTSYSINAHISDTYTSDMHVSMMHMSMMHVSMLNVFMMQYLM